MPRLPSSFYHGATPPFRPKLYLLVPENGDPRISLCELKLRSKAIRPFADYTQCIFCPENRGNVTNITHSTYNHTNVLFRPLLEIKKKK